MNIEQALEIARKCGEYWDYKPNTWHESLEHLIRLDGCFRAEEMEAFALLLRNKVSPR